MLYFDLLVRDSSSFLILTFRIGLPGFREIDVYGIYSSEVLAV